MDELLVEKNRSYPIGSENLDVFTKFLDRLKEPTRLSNGDVLALARITCYGRNRIYAFTAKVLLINHGLNAGRIWIDDGEEGFGEENVLLGIKDRKYSPGRTGGELVIEATGIEYILHRIDLEEAMY